ncbi:MAG: cytochrome c biogenesis protein CcdA [Limnochordia bacterium]|jgi:cytochrome c-type biogenesis protein|nr:cytochrome c biogenesis protein CcdA [Limnochordia bacterium]MDI9463958.1 cytochrome c biogenesis protein CcdA [Bacillota bacterium]NLO95780.1 cytochrome c biogenesis protein CcdA [Bacillota bacterium]HOB40755.1 cytochrome c biogenesis protein CcdA [Limnochordia bacterium]HOK31751.1 cytochrome c biogenesis protein CcdA [Limnochordia bacterium]
MLQQLAPQVTPSLFGLIFVEGLLAFLSPCILPMIPIYLLYLGGEEAAGERAGVRLFLNTLGFIAGFTVVFVALGATASALGRLIAGNRLLLQRLGGLVIILIGLNYLGVIRIGLLNRGRTLRADTSNLRFWSSLLFGAAFSLGWTPCLGAFLGTALILASNLNTLFQGMALLFTFSLGLGVPFLLTALLWGKLQNALGVIKRNLPRIQAVSGLLLIAVGLLMLFDLFRFYANLFI